MKNNLIQKLPNGMMLVAELINNPDYLGMQISLQGNGMDKTDEIICIAEFDIRKPNGLELGVRSYTHDEDEPIYNGSYFKTAVKNQVQDDKKFLDCLSKSAG